MVLPMPGSRGWRAGWGVGSEGSGAAATEHRTIRRLDDDRAGADAIELVQGLRLDLLRAVQRSRQGALRARWVWRMGLGPANRQRQA